MLRFFTFVLFVFPVFHAMSAYQVSAKFNPNSTIYNRVSAKVDYIDTYDNAPNPCYNPIESWSCSLYFVLKSGRSYSIVNGVCGGRCNAQRRWIVDSKTMGDLGSAMISDGWFMNYQTGIGASVEKACVFLGYISDNGGATYAIIPGGECVPIEIAPGVCTAAASDIIYGPISSDSINGAIKTAMLSVTCDRDMSLFVRYATSNPENTINLRSDGSIKTRLTINGKKISEGVPIKVNTTTVNLPLQSELLATGNVAPGPFNGSATIIITVS